MRSSKKRNRQLEKRKIRQQEKRSTVTHDVMMGRVILRKWGAGVAK